MLEAVILGEGLRLPVVADGLVETVCEELGQVVGLKDAKPVVECVTAAVLELLYLPRASQSRSAALSESLKPGVRR